MFETLFFYSLWQIFYVYQMSFFLQNCVVFLLFCVAIVISEPFFGAYFRPDFAAIGRKKFAAQYIWFETKLKQKKFIFK